MTAETPAAARHSPHLEIFRQKGIEVLLLSDRVDEWLVAHLTEYKGKPLQSVAKGQVDLNAEGETQQEDEAVQEGAHAELIGRLKKALGEDAKDVRFSRRLVESPACLVVEDYEMSQNLTRMLKQLGQEAPAAKPILEINAGHPLVQRMQGEADEDRFADFARLLFDQAKLAEGGQLEDPATFVHRLNKLMLSLSAAS